MMFSSSVDRFMSVLFPVADYANSQLSFQDSEGAKYDLAPCPEKYQVRIDRRVNLADYQLNPDDPNQLIFDNPLTGSPILEDGLVYIFKGNTRLMAVRQAFEQNLERYRETGSITDNFWKLPEIKLEFLTEEDYSNPEYLFTLSRIDNKVAQTTVRDQVYQVGNYWNLLTEEYPDWKAEDYRSKTAKYFQISSGTVDLYRKILTTLSIPEIAELVESKQLSVTFVNDFYKSYDNYVAQYPLESINLSQFVALCQSEAVLFSAEDKTVGKVPAITARVVNRVIESIKPSSQEEQIEQAQESIEKDQKQKKDAASALEKQRIKSMTLGQLAVSFAELAKSVQDEFLPLMDLDFSSLGVANAQEFFQTFVADRLSALSPDLTSIYSIREAKVAYQQLSKVQQELQSMKSVLFKQVELFESLFDGNSPRYLKTSEERKQDRKQKKEALATACTTESDQALAVADIDL